MGASEVLGERKRYRSNGIVPELTGESARCPCCNPLRRVRRAFSESIIRVGAGSSSSFIINSIGGLNAGNGNPANSGGALPTPSLTVTSLSLDLVHVTGFGADPQRIGGSLWDPYDPTNTKFTRGGNAFHGIDKLSVVLPWSWERGRTTGGGRWSCEVRFLQLPSLAVLLRVIHQSSVEQPDTMFPGR